MPIMAEIKIHILERLSFRSIQLKSYLDQIFLIIPHESLDVHEFIYWLPINVGEWVGDKLS